MGYECFSVHLWPNYHSIDELNIHRAVYWIQAHGITPKQASTNNGRKLGNLLGTVIDVERPEETGNKIFLRVRVEFDTKRPLATFVNLPRPHLNPTKLKLRYEILKLFCYKCGRLGHLSMACRHEINSRLKELGLSMIILWWLIHHRSQCSHRSGFLWSFRMHQLPVSFAGVRKLFPILK